MSLEFLIRRLGYILLTLILVSAVVFGVTQVLPGNAAVMILGEFATPEALRAVEVQLGLDRPVAMQFLHWLAGLLTGDWGTSMRMSQPVLPVVMTACSRSLLLAGLALMTVTLIAVPLGVFAGLHRGGPIDLAVSVISYVGVSVPEFVTAMLLIALLASPELGLFPAGGYVPFSDGALPALHRLVLPVAALAVILVAHISRQTRSEFVDVMQTEYVRTAVLKGLSRRQVVVRHALRNALVPVVTVIALDVGYLVGGIIVVEEVFAFPGLGRLLIFAIQNRDLPLIQGASLVLAAIFALSNLLADLAYGLLDPRIQQE